MSTNRPALRNSQNTESKFVVFKDERTVETAPINVKTPSKPPRERSRSLARSLSEKPSDKEPLLRASGTAPLVAPRKKGISLTNSPTVSRQPELSSSLDGSMSPPDNEHVE